MNIALPPLRVLAWIALWVTPVVVVAAEAPGANGFEPVTPEPVPQVAEPTVSAHNGVSNTNPMVNPAAIDPVAVGIDPIRNSLSRIEQDLKQARAQAQEMAETNRRLSELNAELRQEIESLAVELQSVRAVGELRTWLYGGGLVITGLLLGRLFATRRRSSAWN
ncbi:MAG: hypothetical protein ACO3Z6_15840 [Pseudomonadales bacterium]